MAIACLRNLLSGLFTDYTMRTKLRSWFCVGLALMLFCTLGCGGGEGPQSFARLQLAHNPACLNNTPYCRGPISTIGNTGVGLVALGAQSGVLYGGINIG